MNTPDFFDALISIVSDLPQKLSSEARYQRLLDALQASFPCNAACLLRLEGAILKPLAISGLAEDTMGRRFVVDEHPRFARILSVQEPVRFPADSELPDPYDGLAETNDRQLHVHDCMGATLYIDQRPWGVMTLDASRPGSFDKIDPRKLRAFISLAEASIQAATRIENLEDRVVREQQVAQSQLQEVHSGEIIGNSEVIEQLKNELEIVAQSHLTVLILGETGVGKELVARQIHRQSTRSDQPLVHINCAALPENIAESELFGHVKGAFTGADSHRAGKFELADGGTLFLDEIGELPLTIQAKLLRALQSGEIQRIGSDHHIEVDVRIIAATNRNLKQAVADHRFRPDLYHRLSVYPLLVPPLKERDKDVLLLASYFLEANQKRFGVQALRLSQDAKQALISYSWPGNVRELEHLLSRASLKAINRHGGDGSSIINIDSVYLDISEQDIGDQGIAQPHHAVKELARAALPKHVSLKDALEQFQADLIRERLNDNQGNQAATAKELGVNRSNFYRLLKRLNIS